VSHIALIPCARWTVAALVPITALAGCHRRPAWTEAEGVQPLPCGAPGTLQLRHAPAAAGAASEVVLRALAADGGAAVSSAAVTLRGVARTACVR
jgi:hypothetical protein